MPFDAHRWPNAVTVADLIGQGLPLGVHCNPCGKFARVDPVPLHLSGDVPVPALSGRFKCTRCGSTDSSVRPEWGSRRTAEPDASLIVREGT